MFCADKRIPRNYFKDSWTRYIEINIPVIEIEKWNTVKENLETMLNFLTGDNWSFDFRKSTHKLRCEKKSKHKLIHSNEFDGVSLFSGG